MAKEHVETSLYDSYEKGRQIGVVSWIGRKQEGRLKVNSQGFQRKPITRTGEIDRSSFYYRGETYNGKPHGEGTVYFTSGGSYVGSFKDGKYEGYGTYNYPNGGKYVGGWLNGLRSGQGRMIYTNGDIYEGTWKEGRKWGTGTLTKPGGENYKGEFMNNKKHGKGILFTKKGDTLDGIWIQGTFQVPRETCSSCRRQKRGECFGKSELCVDYLPLTPKEAL